MVALSATSPLAHLHAAFLTILPRIERHGQIYFRHVRCPQSKDDAIAEMVALTWRWFLRLIAKGKDPLSFPVMLATYAARQVNEGRRCQGTRIPSSLRDTNPYESRKGRRGILSPQTPSATREGGLRRKNAWQAGRDDCSEKLASRNFAKFVSSDSRLVRKEKSKDVLSLCAQKQHGFAVESLPSSTASSFEERYSEIHGQQKQDVFEERLRDNTQTPVVEQVCFRIDFPVWLETLTPRERRLVHEMANNERTLDLSQRFELSPGRISQKRRELHADWSRFCGDCTGE
jgi:hypothetical protein